MRKTLRKITCNLCGKRKPSNEMELMQRGLGLNYSKNVTVIENHIRRYVERRTNKKIVGFPFLCFDCIATWEIQQILSGDDKSLF